MDNHQLHEAPLKNSQELPRELEAAIQKHDGRQFKIEERQGWGSTTGGLELVKRHLGTLGAAVTVSLSPACRKPAHAAETALVNVIRGLSVDVIALAIIQPALHSLAKQDTQMETAEAIGGALAGECWAAELTEAEVDVVGKNDQTFRLSAASLHKVVTRRYSTLKARTHAAKELAARNGFKGREWTRDLKVRAGTWGLNILTTALPDVFQWRASETPTAKGLDVTKYLEITEGAWETVDAILHHTITSRPVWFPSATPPKPWDAWAGCGSNDPRVNSVTRFLRTTHKDTGAAVREAIRSGQMQPALDGVNALQEVPWAINTSVLDVMVELEARDVPMKGLTSRTPVKMLKRCTDAEWAAMDEGAKKLKGMKSHELRLMAGAAKCDRVMFTSDIVQAQELALMGRFYTPMNCDWRGRIYSLSHFNFHREDRVRALFRFADGEPIGEVGLWWLKVHVANCGDFNKISKQPLKERAEWTDANLTMISLVATKPLENVELWRGADKPFLFLAACMEIYAAMRCGPSFVTTLPLAFDGTCSGLQHLSAMTRASEGAYVNLTPSALPQDIYQLVADITLTKLTAALSTEPEGIEEKQIEAAARARAIARLALDFGISRAEVKRNVMTYAYSSKKFGMACQLQVDLMKPLAKEVLEGKREEHPFHLYQDGSEERPSAAARFLAEIIFNAIEQMVQKPSEAMKYLQKLAKATAHEGKPLRWTTPVGIPWINRYHDPVTKRVELWLNDGGVKVRSQITVAVGDQPAINKEKAASGVAPNFVHALDAAHLLKVAVAAKSAGIKGIATVHDSFGCLACHAPTFNRIIREQFAQMYEEHDVLSEVLETAKHDLTDDNNNRLPLTISQGPLNLQDILNAEFAFS